MVASSTVISLEQKIATYDSLELRNSTSSNSSIKNNNNDSNNKELPVGSVGSNISTNNDNYGMICTHGNNLMRTWMKVIGNLTHQCVAAQDMLRTTNSLITVLNHTYTNFNNPLLREYSLLCIRHACEGNLANQELIQNITVNNVKA